MREIGNPWPSSLNRLLLTVCAVVVLAAGTSLRAEPPATAVQEPNADKATPAADNAKKKATAEKEDEEPLGSEWVRLDQDEKGSPRGMQTAIVKYRSKATPGKPAVEVDLVGAVHVGDKAYYDDLNKRFEAYDALLYELVAPEGTRITKGTKASSRHALGAMQNSMKSVLGLEHQLEQIDYEKENFVHADMSPTEFFKSMEDRGESFLEMYFRLVGQAIAMQNKKGGSGTGDIELIMAMFSDDPNRQFKIAFARQLSEVESLLTAFGGKDGSTLIHERNKKALEVLRKQIDGGKKKLGVFYGAGHLADMHERLVAEFGLEPVEITWVTAWDLRSKKERAKDKRGQ